MALCKTLGIFFILLDEVLLDWCCHLGGFSKNRLVAGMKDMRKWYEYQG